MHVAARDAMLRAGIGFSYLVAGQDVTGCTVVIADSVDRDRQPDVRPTRDLSGAAKIVLLPGDIALHLRARRLLHDEAIARIALPKLRESLETLGTSPDHIAARPVVALMRTDAERAAPLQRLEFDPSAVFAHESDIGSATIATWCLLSSVAAPARVVTDRLHVAYAAALLGTSCGLYDNVSGTNSTAYDAALRTFRTITLESRVADGS